jgi:hypothetical protein
MPSETPAVPRSWRGGCAQPGLTVFLAAWIGEGLTELLEKEKAILGAANGVLAFSAALMADLAVPDEYAALLTRAAAGSSRC